MTERATKLRPLGLITQPNKHGQYPEGAMSTAQNVVMRAPGVVEPAKAGTQLASNSPGDPFTWRRMWKYSDSTFLAFGDSSGATKTYAWGATSAITTPTYWEGMLSGGGTGKSAMPARSRMFIGGDGGVIVTDSGTDTTARMAGLPAMQELTISSGGTGGFLEEGNACKYRVIVTRKQSDGYLLLSPPSYAINAVNSTGSGNDYDVTVTVAWANTVGLFPYEAGDVVEVYRTPQQAEANDSGETYLRSASITLTSSHIAAFTASVVDVTDDDNLGEALYTNPGQQGALQANYPPATASDMAAFKGYAFYVTPVTARKFQVRVNTGSLGTVDPYRIGTRSVSATTTSGSPTLTLVTSTVGVVAGQRVSGAGIPAGTLVVSTGAGTITMSANATASSAGVTVTIKDVIEIGGDLHPFGSIGELITSVRSNLSSSAGWNFVLDYAPLTVVSSGAGGYTLGAITIGFQRPYYLAEGNSGDATFRATNGANYIPELPDLNETAKTADLDQKYNRLTFSKLDQPEAVPLVSELLIGNGTIRRIIATQDVLYVFASDGLWRITGGGPLASDWQVDIVDPGLTLANPLAADAMLGAVWAYTNRGLVAIQYDSVTEISRGLIGDVLPAVATTTTSNANTFLVCDPVNGEARLTTTSSGTSTTYVYNTTSKAFTTQIGSGIDSNTARVVSELFLPTYGVIWSTAHDATTAKVWRPSDSTYRTDALVHFQPLHGDGDPFTLKQWNDYEMLFRGAHASLTLDMYVNGVESSSNVAQTTQNSEARFVAAVGLDDAMAPHISYGFAPDTQASAGWQLVGLSTRWTFLSEQVQK